jgi:hypothetical protein
MATEKAKPKDFLLDDAGVAALARDYVDGVSRTDRVSSTYLRVLVAHSQKELNAKRVTEDAALAAVGRAHTRLYAIVMQAVTTEDIAPDPDLPAEEAHTRAMERNRRSNFARTAKSTLVAWIYAGGKLRSLDPATVIKADLRALYAGKTPPLPARIKRTEARLTTLLKELAEEDLGAARERVTELIRALTDAVPMPQLVRTVAPRRDARAAAH